MTTHLRRICELGVHYLDLTEPASWLSYPERCHPPGRSDTGPRHGWLDLGGHRPTSGSQGGQCGEMTRKRPSIQGSEARQRARRTEADGRRGQRHVQRAVV
jgi:hypothetical protein